MIKIIGLLPFFEHGFQSGNALAFFYYPVAAAVISMVSIRFHCAARGVNGFLRSLRPATKLLGTDARREGKKSPLFELARLLVRLDHAARFRYRRAALFFLGAAFPFPGRHFSKTTREEARV